MSKSIPAETVRGEGNSAIAPDTGRPLSRVSVMRFAIGFTFFSVLWAMSATMGSSMLLPQRFNGLGIGRPEAILGIMNSVGVLFALVANLVLVHSPTLRIVDSAGARRGFFPADSLPVSGFTSPLFP